MDVKRYFRGPFVAVLVVLLLFFFLYRYASSGTSYKQVDTSQVISLIDTGKVKSALLIDTDQTIQITTKTGQSLQASWVGNQGQQLATTLQQQHTNYNVQVPRGSSIFALILSWLPFLLIILVFLFLMNQMQGGGSRVMNFGKSKAKLITKDTPKTRSRSSRRSRSSCRAPASSRPSGPRSRRACCSTARRAPARPCWRAPWPARRGSRSTRSQAPTLSRCSSASAPPGSGICSSRPRPTPPRSSSSTRSTRWAGTGAPASAAATTSASRR